MGIKGTGDLSAIGGVNISLVNLPGIKFDFTKLIDPTAKGFNKVFNIILGKVHADKIRHIALSAAQTNADIKKIEQGLVSYNPEDKSLVRHSEDFKNLITSSIQDEEVTNILRCALFAANSIDENNNSHELSQDFINRWRNDARQISSEELQNVWGKILSAEINKPNTISLRTLNTLKNISKEEAENFRYLSQYITFSGLFIVPFTSIPRNYLVPHQLLLSAKDAGLIDMTALFMHTSTNWEIKEAYINSQLQECYCLETSAFLFLLPVTSCPKPPIFSTWLLTSVGQTLYNTIEMESSYENEVLSNILLSIQERVSEVGLSYVYYIDKIKKEDSIPTLHEY